MSEYTKEKLKHYSDKTKFNICITTPKTQQRK